MKIIMTGQKTCSCCGPSAAVKTSCPACGTLSPEVERATVMAILKKTVKLPADGVFSVCVNPACGVAYFSGGRTWAVKDAAVPLDFKKGAKVRYACYCNKLTYEEVTQVYKRTGAVNWAEVVKAAKGAVKPSKCAEKNPFGKCCHGNSFKNALEEAQAAGKKNETKK